MTNQRNVLVEVSISIQALIRMRKDKFLQQNKKWYHREITRLTDSRGDRPTERIGVFNVTPRGHERRRIAWHMAMEKGVLIIYIDDLLYHVTDVKYVDNWNFLAAQKKVSQHNYGPYVPYHRL